MSVKKIKAPSKARSKKHNDFIKKMDGDLINALSMDHDHAYLFRLIAFKLRRMAIHMLTHNIHEGNAETATDICLALATCERLLADDYMTPIMSDLLDKYPLGESNHWSEEDQALFQKESEMEEWKRWNDEEEFFEHLKQFRKWWC